ncbi:MAG: hypothetical protein IJ677_02660 [Alphaproteobacteria bacterium]|nr:hypothetical protein [Alphaproteobacteria bacterium]
MLIRTKQKLKKWVVRAGVLTAVVLLCYVNVRRLNNNIYSNYEKAVEYGRVSENKEIIEPVIAVVFHNNPISKKKNISTYVDHSDNYKEQNVKIVILPTTLTADSIPVAERLYAEINKYNQINKVVLITENEKEIVQHKEMLQNINNIKDIEVVKLSESDISSESKIEKYFHKNNVLVVALVDLNNLNKLKNNFLADEIVWLAQKYAYKMHVFDAIDTQLAKAAEKDYESQFSLSVSKEEPLLKKQQRNLQKYINQYKVPLLKYFKQNMRLGEEKETIWPAKTAQTYRLYDRGSVYIRFFGENDKELFARAKIGKNKGIIVAVIELARKAARKITSPIKSYKIYILTDFEPIVGNEQSLVNDLETDDGVYVKYKGKKALMVADERNQYSRNWLSLLYARAGVTGNAVKDDIELFRFKTVEIENEN